MQVRNIIRTIAVVLWTIIKAIFSLILDIFYIDDDDLMDDLRESYYWEDFGMY